MFRLLTGSVSAWCSVRVRLRIAHIVGAKSPRGVSKSPLERREKCSRNTGATIGWENVRGDPRRLRERARPRCGRVFARRDELPARPASSRLWRWRLGHSQEHSGAAPRGHAPAGAAPRPPRRSSETRAHKGEIRNESTHDAGGLPGAPCHSRPDLHGPRARGAEPSSSEHGSR
jgi:hypothetical protein